jgi:hypothetical protein
MRLRQQWTSFAEKKRKKRRSRRKIRLKQYVSLCSKGRHNYQNIVEKDFIYYNIIAIKWGKSTHFTIRRCVAYRNDLCGALTFDLKVK